MTDLYRCADGTDFPVDWDDPRDADRTWAWEAEHYPRPLTPLSVDFSARIFTEPGSVRFLANMLGIDRSTIGKRVTTYPHGFAYLAVPPEAGQAATPEGDAAEQRRKAAELAPRTREIWEREHIPVIRAACRESQRDDHASLSAVKLCSRLEELMGKTAYGYSLTFVSATPMFSCVEPLREFLCEEYGGQGGMATALMTEGFANESSAADIGLWRLGRRALSLPEVALGLRDHDVDRLRNILAQAEGGEGFLRDLHGYLDHYGWRSETWDELSAPTWQDDAGPALFLIRRYMAGDDPDPNKAVAASAARRRRAVIKARSKLSGSRVKLKRFESLLANSRQYVPVREGRALWQLTLSGSLRVPCLELGRKLQRSGALDQAEDIFYLRLGEVRRAVESPDGESWPELAATRKADRQRWLSKAPPKFIGKVTDRGDGEPDSGQGGQDDRRELRGSAASRGKVTATAKVVRSLEDSYKVQSGDVLVCRTTSPAWTPLFTRAAAVVAETGGILAHCAIVAREYGVPCVVAVSGCTDLIQDGAMITVDGTEGTVVVGG